MGADPIAAFWEFWRRSEAAMGEAIARGTLSEWVDPVAQHVEAIDEDLQWEFGPGRKARHYFCVAAAGDSRLRVLAERWRAAGPSDSELFEFHAARPGTGFQPGVVLEYEGTRFESRAFQVTVEEDEDRERLHVQIHHPAFAQVDEGVAGNATFIALDSTLGEDEVERWLGAVERSRDPLPDPMDLGGLLGEIAALRSRATGERFVLLEGKLPSGLPSMVLVNRALKRVDHLLLDTHYEVTVPIAQPTPAGFPDGTENEELNALEDELVDQLGPDAVLVGHETREGKRLIHLHAAATGPVPGRLERWQRTVDREVEVSAREDPAWDVLHRW